MRNVVEYFMNLITNFDDAPLWCLIFNRFMGWQLLFLFLTNFKKEEVLNFTVCLLCDYT